jgi:hypothetical protein
MSEEYLRLQGIDGNGIYGWYRNNSNKCLVIHIHGLTHHAGCFLEVLSAEFFSAQGYDHYRVSLYDRPSDSRKLHTSTLSTHAHDIKTVLDHFRGKYDSIYLSAHSLGGLAALIANPEGITAASFWDPSMDVTNFWALGPSLLKMPERRQYQLDYGNIYVLSEDMVEEIKHYPDEKCLTLAGNVKTPMQFIIPEQTIFLASPHTSPENYRQTFGGPFDLRYVKGGNHLFSNEGNRQALFAATLDWFQAHA